MPSSYFKNRRSQKPHLLRAGGHAAEIRDARNDVMLEITGDLWASQSTWLVDPTNGNDGGLGTPSDPIKTVAELNLRFDRLRLKVAPTITFSGDCIDAPFMFNGALAPGLGLTLNATVTTERSGTISAVGGQGASGTYPWQLTTTGITWTSGDVNKRITLSTGHFSFVQEFVDANNVITGAFVNATGTVATPTTTTFTVDILSQLLIPTLNGMANTLANNIAFNNFDFQNTLSGILINQGTNLLLSGCRITKNTTQFVANGPILARGCGFVGAATHTFRGSAITTLTATTWIAGALATGPTQATLSSHSATNCPHTFNSPFFTQINLGRIRNTANPVTVQNGGVLVNTSTLHGATGNSGVGITVKPGSQFQWVGAGAKPTLTGASDTIVGVTAYDYTSLGTGKIEAGTPTAMYQV